MATQKKIKFSSLHDTDKKVQGIQCGLNISYHIFISKESADNQGGNKGNIAFLVAPAGQKFLSFLITYH